MFEYSFHNVEILILAKNEPQLASIPGFYHCVKGEGIVAGNSKEDFCNNTCSKVCRSRISIHLGWNDESIDEAKSVHTEND